MEVLNMNLTYEDNHDFNQWIDGQYESVAILEATFQPSRVLFEMEPETYRLASLQYKQQELDDFKDFVQSEFPFPIAYNFHRFEDRYENFNQRLEILRDVWESIIRFIFAVVVGEFICSNLTIVEAGIRSSDLFSDRLYDKLSVVKKLIQFAFDNTLQLSFLSIINIDIVNKLEELNRSRNSFTHIAALPEDQAQQKAEVYAGEVLLLLKQLKSLSNVLTMRCVGMTDPQHVRYERFMGYAINNTIRSQHIKPEQAVQYSQYFNNTSILVLIGEHIFSLSPFVHFIRDGSHNTKLCFYTKKEGNAPNRKFTYEIIGESRTTEIGDVIFTHQLNRINLLLSNSSSSGRTQRGRRP